MAPPVCLRGLISPLTSTWFFVQPEGQWLGGSCGSTGVRVQPNPFVERDDQTNHPLTNPPGSICTTRHRDHKRETRGNLRAPRFGRVPFGWRRGSKRGLNAWVERQVHRLVSSSVERTTNPATTTPFGLEWTLYGYPGSKNYRDMHLTRSGPGVRSRER